MVPDREHTDFHGSGAEERLFDEFSDQLPDEYRVYHSEHWFRAPDQSNDDQERGEIDFLIAHQEKGLLALEVKGGGIQYDPDSDTWWTINDQGRDRLGKSPALQAKAAQHNLLERLIDNPAVQGKGKFSGVIGWGLVFPDLDEDRGLQLPDIELPRERILFRDDMDDLQSAVDQLFEFWYDHAEFTRPLRDDEWESLTRSVLRREVRVVESLGHFIEKRDREIYRLTEEQYRMLDFLESKHDVFIEGPAGSGKTLLSLEKARRLGSEGIDTLWVCFNKQLRNHVEAQEKGQPFEVYHFHSFAMQLLNQQGIEVEFPDPEDGSAVQQFWKDEVPALLGKAIEQMDRRYEALIVDEAQDFRDNWFLALLDVLTEDRYLYVFFDPNQSIYGDVPGWLKEYEREPNRLYENVRNTKQIGETALRAGKIEDDIQLGPEGRPVRLSNVDDVEKIPGALQKAFHVVFEEEDVPCDRASVLTLSRLNHGPLAEQRVYGNYRLVQQNSGGKTKVQHDTIRSFKGLENDVVFLVYPETKADRNQQLYTGASRAKDFLWIITDDSKAQQRLGIS